jgi:hypothetical protein
MCDLHDDVRRRWQELLEESRRLPCAMRTLPRDASVHVRDNRHPCGIRTREDCLDLRDVLGVIELHVRIAEVQLQSSPKRWLGRASPDLLFGVVFQRVHPAKPDQTIPVPRHLLRSPVVFGTHLRILILNGWTIWVAELIARRQNYGSSDARRIEQAEETV